MQNNTTDDLAQAMKSGVLAVGFGVGYGWTVANKVSEEWRLGAIALGLIAILFALATLISILSLMGGLIGAGITSGLSYSISVFRFHAFRKALALFVGALIAVGGFFIASFHDPKWGIVTAALGFMAVLIPGRWETLKHQPWFARLFRSGRSPDCEFAQVYHLKKFARPFHTIYRQSGGYCSNDLFIGTSTRESS